jgi:hypothetical protein
MSAHKTFGLWATRAALLVYCLWAVLLILPNPGLQYDEALLVLGAVQMRHSPQELALPRDPNTWACVGPRCFPLMTARYVGAIKEYLCVPIFALFGPTAYATRFVSALLGLIGIWGLARLIALGVNPMAAAAVAWILALNPSYLDLTVFDNGAVSIWMCVFGALCASIANYLERRTLATAALAGVFAGLGIWARANFLWLLLAVLAACLIVWRGRLLRPVSHWAAWCVGAVVGGAPFLWYQMISNGGTWEAVDMFSSASGSVAVRWVMFCETLLTDREHRAIWSGPMLPDWQRWIFPAILLCACLVCVLMRSRWAICNVLVLAFLGGAFFLSRLPVSEHHLITLLPIAAVIVAIAGQRFPIPAAPLALLYAGCAVFWQISAIQGLRLTGGVGQWSNGLFTLTDVLEKRFGNREIAVLDWGLKNSFFVLSDGRIKSRENYWASGQPPSFTAETWATLLRQGGVFLINGPRNRMMPEATTLFLSELDRMRPVTNRVIVRQQSGIPFAEIVEVKPNTVGQGRAEAAAAELQISDERHMQGVYGLEQGEWRWTKTNFRIWLAGGSRLEVLVYLPAANKTTLSAKLGEHALCSKALSQAGKYALQCNVNPVWLAPGGQWFDFSVDKAFPVQLPDTRELGLIITGASLEE